LSFDGRRCPVAEEKLAPPFAIDAFTYAGVPRVAAKREDCVMSRKIACFGAKPTYCVLGEMEMMHV